jgi:hypothetical protein
VKRGDTLRKLRNCRQLLHCAPVVGKSTVYRTVNLGDNQQSGPAAAAAEKNTKGESDRAHTPLQRRT